MMTIVILAILIFLYMIYTYYKYKDLPPGPYGIPYFGYTPFLRSKSHEQFKQISLKYGGIFTMNILNEPVVVVNDQESIREVLVTKGGTFSGRPHQFLIDFMLQQKEIVSGYGPVWKEQKRFAIKSMQEFGLGTSKIEGVILHEVADVIQKLEQENGKIVEITSLFFNSILNIIWEITAGKRFDTSDKDFVSLRDALQYLYLTAGTISILNIMPLLRYIAPKMTGYSKMCSQLNILLDYFRREVNLHWNDDNCNDIIGHYIAEIKKRLHGSNNIEAPPFDKESLVLVAFNFFDAGSEPVNSTLNWGLLYIALWPNVQRKLQKELDSVMGNDLYLSYDSKERVPYTMATLQEINRFSSVAHFGVPHAPIKDTTIKGYRIKKGTMIITNLWGLHYDENVWGDPREFRPERFLDKDGKLLKHDSLLPFGAGPRRCIGKHTAELQMFLFLTSLVHRFSFEPNPGEPRPSIDPILGATLRVPNYSLVVKLRT